MKKCYSFLSHCLPFLSEKYDQSGCDNHPVKFARLFGVRENALGAHDIMYVRFYKSSFCSDNDPRCYSF